MMLSFTSSISAQDWAKKMLDKDSHDFGTVARGAKVEYKFIIENIYEEEAHIASYRSSCSCTTVQLNKQTLKTWEKAELTATLDTKAFVGQRDATITVVIDAPFSAELQIHVHAYIRSDVVVRPEVVQFGTVALGSALKKSAVVSYAGRVNHSGISDWKIAGVECASPFLEGKVTETSRVGNQVKYDLSVSLKENAPVGYVKDNVILVTNDQDPRFSRIPVPVEAFIASPLTVRPNPLFLGVVPKGTTASRTLVVQSSASTPAPFHITAVTSSDPLFEVTVPTEAKSPHVLPVLFKGTEEPGRITAKLHLETDIPNAQPIDVTVNVQVTP
jgi:hypothetical protein